MANELSASHSGPAREPWAEIDDVLDQIAKLAASDVSAPEFYSELIRRIVPATAAVAGAVWAGETDGPPALQFQTNLAGAGLPPDGDDTRRHEELVRRAVRSGKPAVYAPRPPHAGEAEEANPTPYVLILCPWTEEDVTGVVELIQRPGATSSAQQGYVRLLGAVAELATDFHRHRRQREFRRRMDRLGQYQQFAEQVHGTLDLNRTAYRIANEGRRLIGCDRLSVAILCGSKCRLTAMSGVDHVNRRANPVRILEQLAGSVVTWGEPLWCPSDSADLPPAIQQPLDDYLDLSHASAVAVIPLAASDTVRPPETVGVMVLEQFQGGIDEPMRAAASSALRHSALALANAVQTERVPLGRVLRAVGRARWFVQARQLPRTILVIAVLAAVAIAMAVVPADFQVKARGELQPVRQYDIFAPNDGVVSRLNVGHADQVRARQVLVEIRRPELDFEFKRVWGELQTAGKRAAAVEAERLQMDRQSEQQRRRYGQFTAEAEELAALIGSLEKQYQILVQEQSEMEVRSPTNGEVLTWDLRRLLEARPVSRGQVLMTVADLTGPWELQLQVPDKRIAHVLAAQNARNEPLDVWFVLATDPAGKFRGRIHDVGARTEYNEQGEAFVLAKVQINRDEIPELVPGATVVAKIKCGRRSIGYVWLHDLIDAVRLWVLF